MTQTAQTWLFIAPLLLASTLQAEEPTPSSPGLAAWQKGQQALLEGQNEQAIASFRQSLEQDSGLVQNHLSLAAAHLGLGEQEKAVEQLERYLQAKPDHFVVRDQYAELLLRMDRLDAAREQFERFAEDVQDHESLAQQHLVTCHGRLLEIARKSDDDYGMHLHRGIGLYWLARQRSGLPDADDDELSTEGLLCQAASELVQARRQRPEEARPCWYLHEVWSQLAQRQPATRWLRAAEDAAPFSYLTPAEQRQLHFACRRRAEEGSRK
jgi:tetratricopeptide (TPR) repeat protein